jgi:tetratricopeptide (TPR) repeat protein
MKRFSEWAHKNPIKWAIWALACAWGPGCKEPDGATKPEQNVASDPPGSPERTNPLDDDARVAIYERHRDRFAAADAPALADADWERAAVELRAIANEAESPSLRANAALLLGGMYERRGQGEPAIEFYRLAATLVADDAGPHMALALALAEAGRLPEAIEAQKQAAKLDPDNLENWLALGEMFHKLGDEQSSLAAYADYERRRTGLINGLTLATDQQYVISAAQRAECALALASASDTGTGVALVYALKTDPDPEVRKAVAQALGIQRLTMYREPLAEALAKETDPQAREAMSRAQAEIARDPVEPSPPGDPGGSRQAGR